MQTLLHPLSDDESNQSAEESPKQHYKSIVPVQYRNVYGIPFLRMRSHYYGRLKVILSISSIVSYFVVSHVSPTENFFVDQIVINTIEYVVMSWFIVPFSQTHSWVADATPASGQRRRCCWRLRDGSYVRKPPECLEHPREPNTRYMPFSLYNDVFMALHEGYMLNPELNEAHDHFSAPTQLFIQSVIYRGLLNFFLFLNALFQVRLVLRNEHDSLWALALTVNSLLVCTLNLQAYLWAVVFCVVLTPYLLYSLLERLFSCLLLAPPALEERRGEDAPSKHIHGSRRAMKGSYLYGCLVFVWKRVNF